MQYHVYSQRRYTHIKVVPSMLQDELGGVRFVLTVVHIHLEFIRLGRERKMIILERFDSE